MGSSLSAPITRTLEKLSEKEISEEDLSEFLLE
jgi:hypothetical protein